MLRKTDDFEAMLEAMLAKPKREYKFNKTYVSSLYTIYTTQSAARSLYNIIGLIDSREWALRCVATIAQPLAHATGYRRVETVAGYVAIGTSMLINPVPTIFSLSSHLLADRVLTYGWEHTPAWCENSFVARELYAIAYVMKSQGIAYCEREIDASMNAARLAAAKKAADKAAAAARKAAEEAAAAQRTAEAAAAAAEQAAKNTAGTQQEELANQAAIDAALAAKKIADDAAAAQQASNGKTTANQDALNAITYGAPKWFNKYMEYISIFTHLAINRYKIFRLNHDGSPRGDELTLEQAIMYFLNGGALMFTHPYEDDVFKYTQTWEHERQPWRKISIHEITNPMIIKLGITWRVISNLVDKMTWDRTNANTGDKARRYSYIKRYVTNHFWSLWKSLIKPSSEQPLEQPPQDTSLLVPPTQDAPTQQSTLLTMDDNAATAAGTARIAADNYIAAKTQAREATANLNALKLNISSTNTLIQHTTSQFSAMSNSVELAVNTSATAQESAKVIHHPEITHSSPPTEIRHNIETDKQTIQAIQNARLARAKSYETSENIFAAAKVRMAQLKMKKTLTMQPPALVQAPQQTASLSVVKPNNTYRKNKVKHAPTFFALAERDASISAQQMSNSAFGMGRGKP